MLSKDRRLNLAKDFQWVAAGQSFQTKYLKISIKSGDSKIARVGIAVSAKFFKNAVERNRARRITSAAFEILYPILPVGINIVALPKAGVLGVKSGEVLADLEQGLKREKII